MPGEQQPREREVLELAQVGQLVVRGQVPLACPRLGLGEFAAPQPQPCPHRGNRPDVRVVDAVRLVQQSDQSPLIVRTSHHV